MEVDIRLRKLCRQDLPLLLELKEESWRTTHHTSILNESDQIRWFESLDSNPISPRNLVMIACATESIGVFKFSSIDWQNASAEVGWDVFAPFRGKKLGKSLVLAGVRFAFQKLSLRRLSCEILKSNVASIKCAENAGFVAEGLKRGAIIKCGVAIDSIVYGQLTSDSPFLWDRN